MQIHSRAAIAVFVSFSTVGLACFTPGDTPNCTPTGGVSIPDAAIATPCPIRRRRSPTQATTLEHRRRATRARATIDGAELRDVHDTSRWSQPRSPSVGVTQRSSPPRCSTGATSTSIRLRRLVDPQSQIAVTTPRPRGPHRAPWTSSISRPSGQREGARRAERSTALRLFRAARKGQRRNRDRPLRTLAPFATASSWTVFDRRRSEPLPPRFEAPRSTGVGVHVRRMGRTMYNAYAVRYDTQAAFGQAAVVEELPECRSSFPYAEWSERRRQRWPLRVLQPSTSQRRPPRTSFATTRTSASRILRVDELQPDDVVPENVTYSPGMFDGRYVLLPNTSGKIVQLDPQLAFTTSAAWKVFDATTVDADAKGFTRAAFDGRYVHFAQSYTQPNGKAPMARFRHARRVHERGFVDDDRSRAVRVAAGVQRRGRFAFRRTLHVRRAPNIDDQTTRSASTCERPPAVAAVVQGLVLLHDSPSIVHASFFVSRSDGVARECGEGMVPPGPPQSITCDGCQRSCRSSRDWKGNLRVSPVLAKMNLVEDRRAQLGSRRASGSSTSTGVRSGRCACAARRSI